MSTRRVRWFVLASLGLAAGCGCDEANLSGTVFTRNNGTGTIEGTITARGAPEDRPIEIMIAPEGTGARYGVIPDDLMAPTSCGDTIRYQIHNLDAGSYKLLGKVESSNGAVSEYEGWFAGGGSAVVTVGTATAVVLVDGETLTGVDFELVNVLN